ncbi:MAG: hypothetical protein AAF212_05775 [Verrucomicrobiota bacterium]
MKTVTGYILSVVAICLLGALLVSFGAGTRQTWTSEDPSFVTYTSSFLKFAGQCFLYFLALIPILAILRGGLTLINPDRFSDEVVAFELMEKKFLPIIESDAYEGEVSDEVMSKFEPYTDRDLIDVLEKVNGKTNPELVAGLARIAQKRLKSVAG